MFEDIHIYMGLFKDISFSHIYREMNVTMDVLSKVGVGMEDNK